MRRAFTLSRGLVEVGELVLPGGVTRTTSPTAPTDGPTGTGAGRYARGSTVIALDTGIKYSNVGTKASPEWQKANTAVFHSASASVSSSVSPSGSASKSPSASVSPSSSSSPSKSPSASTSPSASASPS